MKAAALLAVLLWQAAGNEPPVVQPGAMRYERAIRVAGGAGQACAVLDAQIFPHAAPSLTDLRIFPAQEAAAGAAVHEVPYAITLSEAASEETETARALNLGASGARIVFDLEMPARAYTGVTLEIDPAVHDFIATATVTGSDSLGGRGRATALGSFTLFDLASQRLSRDTTIALQESTFRYLHVEMNVSAAPGRSTGGAARFVPAMVLGATVAPSREAQTIYTTVASVTVPTSGVLATPRRTRFDLDLPLRVPVERVSFDFLPAYTGNFSRDVTIHASSDANMAGTNATGVLAEPPLETLTGNISRVRSTQDGHTINQQELSVPAVLGANLQRAARVWIEIENGDDQPLPVAAVRLEMRQRKICFEAHAAPSTDSGAIHGSDASSNLALFYGDSRLAAPEYDYERLFVASRAALVAELGAEGLNANYRAPAAEVRPFAERHPEVLWIALIAAICALGLVAMRSAKSSGLG
jgi:hypothetical protein